MRPQIITTVVPTEDPNGIAEAQQPAATFTLNGALVTGGVATAAMAQRVSYASAGNISARTFTTTGTDADGKVITESRAGPNANTVLSTAYFKTVTSVTTDGAVGTDTTIGWEDANGFCTQSIPVNWRQTPFNLTCSAQLQAGTATFGAQWTAGDPEGSWSGTFNTSAFWVDITGLDKDSNSASGTATLSNHVRAVRGIATAADSSTVVQYIFLQGQNG